ncbi:hypothetical protein QMK33_08710 [Hymenobacter sp. H14-R3]|uniref:hypothetical protein n=1 Tax=Hymenobacter sp. H14-R3 TaxID=3046308 RepID=UPI0024BB9101|nr:hypothetical protein [Hymenobacter sp. H14-R3]MDJ0365232.1 hypothetical protein [Hymenobacter sp. H14-R3]
MQSAPAPSADSTPAAGRAKFTMLLLNGTACYLLAYQLVHLLAEAAPVFVARRANIPGIWSLSGIRFILGDGGWQRDSVVNVYGLGPVLLTALGAGAFLLFWLYLRHRRGLPKLLLLWVALHATNAVLGGLLADMVTQSGSWYVPNWLLGGGGTWPSTVLGLLFALVQLGLGFLAAVPFLLAQDSRTALQFENRARLIVYGVAGPWVLGSLLLALSKLPHLGVNEALHYATMGLLLLPLAIGCNQEFSSPNEALPQPTRVAWGLVGLALLGLLAWRLALGTPVAFR